MNKKKKKKQRYLNKEDRLIKLGSRILTIFTIMLCIALGVVNTFKGEDDLTNYLTADFSNLYEAYDPREIVTNPVSDEYRSDMLIKINDAELDITKNDMPNYEKFSQDQIPISSDISFTSQEVALLYSYIYMFNPDTYDVIIQQLSISKTENEVVNINIVSSIDFYKLFTKKVKSQYKADAIKELPKRIYCINNLTIDSGTIVYSKVLYNNMSETESQNVSNIINTATADINMDHYIPDLLMKFLEELSIKTNTTLNYTTDGISLTINSTP